MAGPMVEMTARIITDRGPNTIGSLYWEHHQKKPGWMSRVQAATGPHKTDSVPHIAGRALNIELRASEPNERHIAEELVQIFLRIREDLRFVSVI